MILIICQILEIQVIMIVMLKIKMVFYVKALILLQPTNITCLLHFTSVIQVYMESIMNNVMQRDVKDKF